MSSIDRQPPSSSPPVAEGGITTEPTSLIDTNAGGDISAVGTLRFRRGQSPAMARG